MIAIAPEARVPRRALPKRELAAFVREACAAIPLHGDVAVLLTTDAEVQELNRRFRRKDKPTDVLSFPALPGGFAGEAMLAGDLAISVDTAGRQAAAFGHTLLLEVKVLLLHGLLHLAGFDHEQDAGQMGRHERVLRARFSLPAGLIQRVSTPAISPAMHKDRVKAPVAKLLRADSSTLKPLRPPAKKLSARVRKTAAR